jgi:hypothetical protein
LLLLRQGGRDFFRARSPRDHSAREIREYFIPDFSDWKKHDEYQKAFGRLMGDLKAGEKGEGKMGRKEEDKGKMAT